MGWCVLCKPKCVSYARKNRVLYARQTRAYHIHSKVSFCLWTAHKIQKKIVLLICILGKMHLYYYRGSCENKDTVTFRLPFRPNQAIPINSNSNLDTENRNIPNPTANGALNHCSFTLHFTSTAYTAFDVFCLRHSLSVLFPSLDLNGYERLLLTICSYAESF